jgi:hypothetical protein
VALVIDPATGVPRVDVLSAAGEFTANLRMEAKLTGSGGDYTPALDLFDALKTGQGAAGDALTSLTQGFFFDAVEDLAVSEHDANMEQRTNEIAGLIGFHNQEAVGRLDNLGSQYDAISMLINQVSVDIQQLATQGDVNGVRESLEEFQMAVFQYLWGIEFDEDGNPIFESITRISSLARTRLDLQVVHSSAASGQYKSFLVLATENGAMADDTAITTVVAFSPNDYSPTLIEDYEVVEIAPGLIRLDVDLWGNLNSTKTFMILAEHSNHDFGSDTHRGAILFSANADGANGN